MEMRNKIHTLFGEEASRVTTEEMNRLVGELTVGTAMLISLTRLLPSKETHGDVDFVYVPYPNIDFVKSLKEKFGSQIVKTNSNGDVYSILFNSTVLGKKVHVDFIKATENTFLTKLQYFSYNDFSGIVGIFSKKMNFKYGSEGFFKRFCDKRNNWHDIFISHNLMDGLAILGFDATKFETIKTVDDIVDFMLSSDMVDSLYFGHTELNQSDRKSMKRPVIEYVVGKIREANKKATVTNVDYFFHQLMPDKDIETFKLMLSINDSIAEKSKYDGNWIMSKFSLKPGPVIGKILKYISDVHGEDLDKQDESEIERLVDKYLHMNPQNKETD